MGVKVRKYVHQQGANNSWTDYLNGFQYSNEILQFFPHAEGYVQYYQEGEENGNTNQGNDGAPLQEGFSYVYQYRAERKEIVQWTILANEPAGGLAKGNNRLNYTLNREGTLSILSEDHYYPFGMKHPYNNDRREWAFIRIEDIPTPFVRQVPNSGYQYKYNGKEWQNELNLNLYDYHARNYDPAIGRWMNVDPLAEKYPSWTTYHYVHNNPINMVDPTGMEANGWIKSVIDNKATYTYDATITSQADVDEFLPGKEYMGENFQLIGRIKNTNEVAYEYNFQGKNVTDENGQTVDLTNNHTTKGGSTIMNPNKTGGTFSGLTLGGAVGGGLSLQLGVVSDNFGDSSFYFTFGGNFGLGGGAGITSGVITPTNNQTFAINDFNGMGNSWNVNVGFLSYERGGTQGNGFSDYGNPNSNARSYIYNSGSQAGHYPAAQLNNIIPKAQISGISGGGMISSTRTWVF